MKPTLVFVTTLLSISPSAYAVERGDCTGKDGVDITDVVCTINILLGVPVAPLPQVGSALNPTGITFGGNYPDGNNSRCTGVNISAQDCANGQGTNVGFDFTKLNSAGEVLNIQGADWTNAGSESVGTQWSCVKDNHTGLTWEVKTSSVGVHNKDNTYRWGGVTAIGRDAITQVGTYDDDWNALITDSNDTQFCGGAHWRVPTREELRSIAQNGNTNPAIDSHYFPNTVADWHWSASPSASNSNFAWLFNFSNGGDHAYNRNNSYRVRLVRTGQ